MVIHLIETYFTTICNKDLEKTVYSFDKTEVTCKKCLKHIKSNNYKKFVRKTFKINLQKNTYHF